MGVGAYVAGMVSKWLGWSPWFTIPLGGFISGGMGMLFGYPFSRLRAMYYAMGSLFFGMAVINLIQAGGRVTGGYVGLSGIQPLFTSKISYYYFFLGLSLVSIIAMYRFEFSRIGVTLKAISQSYIVASSVGINESKYRVLAVGVGCFFVGLIGAAYAHYYGIASPVSYNLSATFWILMYALIGGVSTFAGPIIGVPILYLIPQYFSALKEYSPYLIAVMLAIVVYLMPNGIVGLFQSISSRYVKHKNIYL
jgi:branched-chain amino acid transport system permease protein